MDSKEIGRRIKEIRNEQGIKGSFVCRKMGFKARSSLTRIENGEHDLTLLQAIKLAEILRVGINEFLCDEKLRETSKEAVR